MALPVILAHYQAGQAAQCRTLPPKSGQKVYDHYGKRSSIPPETDRDVMRTIITETTQLVNAHWNAILRVARALLIIDWMDQEYLDRQIAWTRRL